MSIASRLQINYDVFTIMKKISIIVKIFFIIVNIIIILLHAGPAPAVR